MRHSIALLATIPFTAACYTVDIAGQSNFNGCVASPVITAGAGISDYKQRIARQTAVAPADSLLSVLLTFVSPVVQSDKDRITAYSGSNVANAGTASSLKAQFVSQDLARYVSEDTTSRLSDVVIYDPACATD